MIAKRQTTNDDLRLIQAALDGFRESSDHSQQVAEFISSSGGKALKVQIMRGLGINEHSVERATRKLAQEGRLVTGACTYKGKTHRAYRLVERK